MDDVSEGEGKPHRQHPGWHVQSEDVDDPVLRQQPVGEPDGSDEEDGGDVAEQSHRTALPPRRAVVADIKEQSRIAATGGPASQAGSDRRGRWSWFVAGLFVGFIPFVVLLLLGFGFPAVGTGGPRSRRKYIDGVGREAAPVRPESRSTALWEAID